MPDGGWTVLVEFDYQPDGQSEVRHVVPGDRVDDISEARAAEMIALGVLAEG